MEPLIDSSLAHLLVATQFPEWKNLPIRQVAVSGWDNRTFHLGEDMLIRMPSRSDYASQVEKEQKWLPKLAPFLPVSIPVPLAMGAPGNGYPFKWSIYLWLDGKTARAGKIDDLSVFAINLAQFLIALQSIDSSDGPLAGPHSFYRGGSLAIYDAETRQAIHALQGKIDSAAAIKVWEASLATSWDALPVWVHGDISAGNLLVQNGRLSAVIDFGQLCIGDPACDLSIAWTFFKSESRKAFRETLPLNAGTWARAKAWTLWKALIVAAGLTNSIASEEERCWSILDEVLQEA